MANLKDRESRENSFSERLRKLSAKYRREAIKLLGNPPDPDNIPEEFWERMEREIGEQLTAAILLIFMMGYRQHAPEEPREEADKEARKYVTDRAHRVAMDMAARTKEYISKLKDLPKPEVVEKVNVILGPERAETVAATETTAATSHSGERAVIRTVGFTDNDTWFTEKDRRVCPICAPLHNTKRAVWSAKFPDGPPTHPRCRCWIHYANEKRGKAVIGTKEDVPSPSQQLFLG